MRKLAKLCDIAVLLIGVVLFMSPWVMGFGSPKPTIPAQTASVSGALIGVSGLATLVGFDVWELFIIVGFGVASVASPWVLQIADARAVLALSIGGVLAIVAAATHLIIIRRNIATPPVHKKRSLGPHYQDNRPSREAGNSPSGVRATRLQ